MAETFKNVRGILDSSVPTTVYTVPVGATAIVIGCQVANVGATNNELDFWWEDATAGNAVTYLAKDIDIPLAAAYEPIGGKLVLEEADQLRGLSETANELEVSVSVLEIT